MAYQYLSAENADIYNAAITNLAALTINGQTATTPYQSVSHIYYVAKAGSDSNDGSYQAPFLTVDHAVDVAPVGSVIYILDGGSYATAGIVL